MTMRRRAALALGALAVGACAPRPAEPPAPPSNPAPSPTTPPEPSPSPSPTPTPTLSPEPTSASPIPTPSLPTRDEVVAAFADASPTQWGLEVDGVVLRHEQQSVVLTFDACGGPNGSGVDEELLAVLEETATPATLFINARWAEANPGRLRELAATPLFEIANHGTTHRPLSVSGQQAYGIAGTTSVAEVYDEVVGVQQLLTDTLGEAPLFFRSGTAHYDDVAVRIVEALGLITVNFDINADAGATFTPEQVHAATSRATAGSICIGHFNRPGSGTARGIRRAIATLQDRGLSFARLGDVLP